MSAVHPTYFNDAFGQLQQMATILQGPPRLCTTLVITIPSLLARSEKEATQAAHGALHVPVTRVDMPIKNISSTEGASHCRTAVAVRARQMPPRYCQPHSQMCVSGHQDRHENSSLRVI